MQYVLSKYYISQFKKIRYEWVVIFCSFLPKSCSLGSSMMRPHLNTPILFVFLVLVFLSQITLGLFPPKKISALLKKASYMRDSKRQSRDFSGGIKCSYIVQYTYWVIVELELS